MCRRKVLLHRSDRCKAANPGQVCLHLRDCVQEPHIKLLYKMAEKASILIPEVMVESLDTSMVEEGRKSSPGQPSCLRMRW